MDHQTSSDVRSNFSYSASFSFDAEYAAETLGSVAAPPIIDDSFDITQFDWILHRSTALGLQDHTEYDQDSPELIGEGINFKVYRCRTYLSLDQGLPQTLVAVKKLKAKVTIGKIPPSPWHQDCLKSLLREIYAMSMLSWHPNILKIHGFGSDYATFEDLSAPDIFSYSPFLVVEYAPLGSLADYLGITGALSESSSPQGDQKIALDVRIQLFVGLGHGIEALHKQGFIHRDIKPHNVLVFPDGQDSVMAKVADFGLTLFHGSDGGQQFNVRQYFGGTERYTAPELVNCSTSDLSIEQMRKGDVFSFGVTCFECLPMRSSQSLELPQSLRTDQNIAGSIESALQDATTSVREAVQNLLSKTLCEANERVSDISDLLAGFRDDTIGTIDTSSPRSETNQNSMSWPMNDSVSPNVFSTSDWKFLDGDENLIRSPGVAARLSALTVAAPWGMQRSIYISLQKAAIFREPTYGKLLFLQGLCWAIGFGVSTDYNKAISLVLEAAKSGYRPAKYTYRRLYQAFCSLVPDSLESASLNAESLRDIDPELNTRLSEIEKAHPNEYLAYACRYSEVETWRERTLRSCPIEITYFTELRIKSSSETEGIRSLRTEIISLSIEAWSAFQNDKSYPIDHLIALSIVFDDLDSSLFRKIAEQFSTILRTWNFHFTSFEAPISPLFLATRVGNIGAVQYLTTSGASPSYKSLLGMIPLHFLFMFDDCETEEMASILSSDLLPAESYIASQTCISEQLCSLVGTPLAFSVQVNHQRSIEALSALEGSNRRTYSSEYQVGPGNLIPGLENPMSGWQDNGQLFDQLAGLYINPSSLGEDHKLMALYDQPGSDLDIAIAIIMVVRVWHLNQSSHWTAHGGLYQQHLQRIIRALFETPVKQNRAEAVKRIHLSLQISLLTVPMYHNENILLAFGTQLQRSVSVQDLDPTLFPAMANMIEATLTRRPHMQTMIEIFPRDSPTKQQLLRSIALSYRCHDIKAFSRILFHQHAYGRQCDAEFILQLIGESPSEETTAFVQALTHFSTTEQLPLDLKHAAVRHAIQRGNEDALNAFHNIWGVSCLKKNHGGNIMHLLCTEDGFAKMLDRTVSSLGKDLTRVLLHTRESTGNLLPVEVALLSGSCESMRVLLAYYALDTFNLDELVDALVVQSDLDTMIVRLMYHFYSQTWYLGRFISWYTDIYLSLENHDTALILWEDWHMRKTVGMSQIMDCISKRTGIENQAHTRMRLNLIYQLEARGYPTIDRLSNSVTGEINSSRNPEITLQLHSRIARLARQLTTIKQISSSSRSRLIGGLGLAAVLWTAVHRYRRSV